MPTLDWLGKKAVLNHHREVPFHLLEEVPELSAGDPDSGNLLVQGDNLLALKALLPYYAGRVKCIYIDPPYNTGNEGWVYNDAVNSPEIREWLGKVVGSESEDLSRHDKWLCMMYPRLQLLKQFLRDDGVICVSIDDHELHHLREVMDEIFGQRHWLATFAWKRRQTSDSRNVTGISVDVEYVVCYARNAIPRFRGEAKDLTKYSNPDDDVRGGWMSDNLTGLANASERPNLHYDLVNPATGHSYPPHPSRGWIYGQERMQQLIEGGRILWPRRQTGRPRLKRFVTDMRAETTGFSTMLSAPANVAGTKELAAILGQKTFAFPKPVELIRQLIEQITDEEDIVLDSFAGSGTTGQAVLEQNIRDGGHRRFVLVELDRDIASLVASERIRRCIVGYEVAIGAQQSVAGLGGGFRFCKLAEPLFDATGSIRNDVSYDELAAHVFFTHTGRPLSRDVAQPPFLGLTDDDEAVYLLYNGILGDRRPQGGNILTTAVLDALPRHGKRRVIYGEGCRIGAARLAREQVTFLQIPYQIRTR
jgi:adenine-specific DNA-methyltransferase